MDNAKRQRFLNIYEFGSVPYHQLGDSLQQVQAHKDEIIEEYGAEIYEGICYSFEDLELRAFLEIRSLSGMDAIRLRLLSVLKEEGVSEYYSPETPFSLTDICKELEHFYDNDEVIFEQINKYRTQAQIPLLEENYDIEIIKSSLLDELAISLITLTVCTPGTEFHDIYQASRLCALFTKYYEDAYNSLDDSIETNGAYFFLFFCSEAYIKQTAAFNPSIDKTINSLFSDLKKLAKSSKKKVQPDILQTVEYLSSLLNNWSLRYLPFELFSLDEFNHELKFRQKLYAYIDTLFEFLSNDKRVNELVVDNLHKYRGIGYLISSIDENDNYNPSMRAREFISRMTLNLIGLLSSMSSS